jgi:hypothetical protein
MDYIKIRSRPESFQSLTSVTVEEFDEMLAYFEREIKWEFRLNSRGKCAKIVGASQMYYLMFQSFYFSH